MIARFNNPEMYVGYGVWRIHGNTVRKDKILYVNFLYGSDEIELTTLYFDKACLDFERPEDVYMTKSEAVKVLRKRAELSYATSRSELECAAKDLKFVAKYCSRKCPKDE